MKLHKCFIFLCRKCEKNLENFPLYRVSQVYYGMEKPLIQMKIGGIMLAEITTLYQIMRSNDILPLPAFGFFLIGAWDGLVKIFRRACVIFMYESWLKETKTHRDFTFMNT